MDPKDKIDLTSVNKTKKQFKLPKLSNPLAKKSAGPGRDQFGQFASGSGGIKGKSTWMNWKVMTVVVLLVAAIGGFYVFKSNASRYTFNQGYAQLMGGAGVVKKADGRGYVKLLPDPRNLKSTVDAIITSTEAKRSDRVCTYFAVLSPKTTIKITPINGTQWVGGDPTGNPSTQFYESTGNYNLCSKTKGVHVGYVSVHLVSGSAGVYSIYGKPGVKSADASCNISVAQATNGYTATWTSKGIDTSEAEEPVTMRLKNSATGTETPDLPLAGSRALSPKAGVNNVYTMTLYEGTTPTDLTCSASVNLAPTTPPPATQVSCSLNITKSGTSYTASWATTGIPSGSNWGATLSRPGGTVSFQPTTGSAGIVPPTGTTTYTVIIYDKAVSSTAAQNSWKTACAANVTK